VTADPSALWLGLGRADLTACVEGMSMWGWGSHANVPRGVGMPLHARAVALAEAPTSPPLVLCSVELGMVCEALRSESLRKLRALGVLLDDARFALCATHTHSGPSGYSSSLWYALAGPGFSSRLLGRLSDGIVAAVREALSALAPGRVRFAKGDVPLSEPLLWNRALAAYNRNPEVTPLKPDRADEAVSRSMAVLRFEGAHGEPRGLLSLFAVHGTSVHADHELLHPDNLGVAAAEVEAQLEDRGHKGFVALFATGPAGDVSPNYRPCPARGVTIGRYDDDFESAAWHGGVQARHAVRLLDDAAGARALTATLRGALQRRVLSRLPIDSDLLPAHALTATACPPGLGVAFTLGTVEGPGPLFPMRALIERLCARARAGGALPKLVDFEARRTRRILGALTGAQFARAGWPDRRLRWYLSSAQGTVADALAWVPDAPPLAVLRIGEVAAALLPCEPTTIAGRRLSRVLAGGLGPGVEHPLVVGCANDYCGYLTTPEEHDAQLYEGASTVYGRNALPAMSTAVRALARALAAGGSSITDDASGAVPFTERLPSVDEPQHRRAARLDRTRREVPRSRGLQ
jgi:neutral ceramidase